MSGMRRVAIEDAPRTTAGKKLQPGVHDSKPTPTFERRMEIPNSTQLRNDPTVVHDLLRYGWLGVNNRGDGAGMVGLGGGGFRP